MTSRSDVEARDAAHRCESVHYISGVRCEREDGHPGYHMHGFEQSANGLTAWGNAKEATKGLRDARAE